MKCFFFILFCFIFFIPVHAQNRTDGNKEQLIHENQLCFIENKGQITDQDGKKRTDIDYKIAAASGLNIFIGNGAIHYQFSKSIPTHVDTQCITSLLHTHNTSLASGEEGRGEVSMYRLDMTLENANPHAKIITAESQCYHENYYTVAANGVQAGSYSRITYQNIYPNIDWVLYIKDNRLEYDFIVRPGGSTSDIQIRYNGASELSAAGKAITALTPMGRVKEDSLYSYEMETGKEITSTYVMDRAMLTFSIAEHKKGTIVIDPRLEWATYYGGSGTMAGSETEPSRIIADTSGNLYITGVTESMSNIATSGAFQTIYEGSTDAFLAKFNNRDILEWATYFGGSGRDVAGGIACDKNNNIFMTGQTGSLEGIATSGAYKGYLSGEYDAFIAKFTAEGSLLWATYYGGSDEDGADAIVCDTAGNAYITGITLSNDSIATPGTYKTTYSSGEDVFLAKFNSSGGLLWGTYYGGEGYTYADGITSDAKGNLYITGDTNCIDSIATTDAYQSTFGGGSGDVFIASFTDIGALVWATYYGGSEQDEPSRIKSDGKGNIYVCGNTYSTNNIATPGAYQPAYSGSEKAFLAKFNDTGSIVWATYFGGNGQDGFTGIAVDNLGNIYASGSTTSTDSISTAGAYQPNINGYWDAMVAEFSSIGSLIWGSYFGGPDADYGYDVTCDNKGNFYLAGITASPEGVATPNAYDTAYYGGGVNVTFIAKFDSLPTDGIKQINKLIVGFNIYPNPANDLLNIKWSGITTQSVQISIINMEGQQLYTATQPGAATHAVIPVSTLSDGMYVCVLQSGVTKYYSKFTVVR